MKKLSVLLILISLFFVNIIYAQITFTRQDFGFLGSSYGAVEFGDYDADGDLDLLVFGLGGEGSDSPVGVIYKNVEGIFNPDSVVDLPHEFSLGVDAKWFDYDGDGDLDIFVAGNAVTTNITSIFRNDNGSFTQLEFDFVGLEDTAVDWGDYDNDGDLDVVVTGGVSSARYLYIYENQEGTFVDSGIEIEGVRQCDIEFVDYDIDGDLDLFVTGSKSSSPSRSSILYKQEAGEFTDSGISFVGMLEASSDFGDFDGDGDQDLLLSGNGSDSIQTVIYRNDNTTLTRMPFPIRSIEQSDVKWADFDNDGDLDFVQSGRVSLISGIYLTEVYENTGSSFTRIEQTIQDSVRNSAISVGDYDDDGDMDFALAGWNSDGDKLTVIYSNNISSDNIAPLRPDGSGSLTAGDGSSVELSWNPGSDNETQASGLTYNLRIGTEPGADDIMSAHITDESEYMLSRRGNMESRLSYTVYGLPPGTYYWAVQTVDNNYEVSNFFPSQFILSVSPMFEETDIGLPDYEYGDMAWGDYDNDRDLDLAVVGLVDGTAVNTIYDNNNGVFTDKGISLSGSPLSNVSWGDYDNDGDLDLLTGGALYRNDFGIFNVVDFYEPSSSDLTFVDFDNDGDLDIFWVQVGQMYRNDNNTFALDSVVSENLIGISGGDAAWGDYDNDGDKDLITTGGNYLGYLYRNDNGTFVNWGYDLYATDYGDNQSTNGYQNADIEWADYDNDGYLDFIIIGEGRNGTPDVARITALYKNNGPDQNNDGQWLFEQTDPQGSRDPNGRFYEAVNNGALSWADFDNNGWRDFIFSGAVGTSINPNDYLTKIYLNKQNDEFYPDPVTNSSESVRGMGSISALSNSALAVADYDNDGDLDYMQFGYSGSEGNGGLDDAARLYKNMLDVNAINQPPLSPTGLSYSLHGDTVFLTWDPAQDDKTAGLTYNVRIGASPGSQDIVSPNAYNDGKMKLVSPGNAQSATTFKLNGLANNQQYYWSVQAIDAGFKSSPFAEESTFNTYPVSIQYPNGGEVFKVDSTIFIDWVSSYVSDFRLEYSSDNGSNWIEITVINETSGQSSEEWTIPNDVSSQCLVRVIDINNTDINDVSDNTFAIVSNIVSGISLIAPDGGEEWEAGRVENIRWNSADITSIKIEFSNNNGGSYVTLQETIPAGNGSYAWTLPNEVFNTCLIRLSDAGDPGTMDVSNASFSIIDTSGPVFDQTEGIIDFTSLTDSGYVDTVSVKVTDNTEVDADAIRIFYRTAGTINNFQQRTMTHVDDEYEWILPETPLTGFQLFAQASDIQGNISTTDTFGVQVKINDSFDNPDENVGGNSVEDYVLFSVPVRLNNSSPAQFLIVNNFDDTPDPQDYRFYSYQNGSPNNFFEYDNNGFGLIDPGRGFFFISNDDFNMLAGVGRTVNPAETFPIDGLKQGWNLIGNPFSYPIPLSNVSAVNPSSGQKVNFSLWRFDGSWQRVQDGELMPWKGYALDLDGDANLKISPFRGALTKTVTKFTTLNNNNNEWMIQIKANNGHSKSDFNFAGQLLNASNTLDKYDLNSPPRIEKQVEISFENEDNLRKVTDIRESNGDGHIWDFICHLNPKEEKLILNFYGIDNFSENTDYFLIDNNTAISYNLKLKNDVEFATKGLSQKDFKLAVGTKEYLESLSLGTELYPTRFTLNQNFPNPFNPSTQISFTIKDAGKVKLAIYDLLGQQVEVLVSDFLEPGNYSSVWDARGESSGIYFIKLSSAKKTAVKRAVFIK